MSTIRSRAAQHRRAYERRLEGEAAREAITYHTTDSTGRSVHMVGWSSKAIAEWERREGAASYALTSTPVESIPVMPKEKNLLAMIKRLLGFG